MMTKTERIAIAQGLTELSVFFYRVIKLLLNQNDEIGKYIYTYPSNIVCLSQNLNLERTTYCKHLEVIL